MIIEVIILDETQCSWVKTQNDTSEYKAIVCNYPLVGGGNSGDCVGSDIMSLTGYEAFATYFYEAPLTDIDIVDDED